MSIWLGSQGRNRPSRKHFGIQPRRLCRRRRTPHPSWRRMRRKPEDEGEAERIRPLDPAAAPMSSPSIPAPPASSAIMNCSRRCLGTKWV